ncbi:MAG: hypothetical protein ABI720_05810 [Actinomycetes bacterium]
MLVAVIALLLTLGGTAVAANLITGRDVKNDSLTGRDVKNGSLTGKDVKNKSLTKRDFKGSVRGPAGLVALEYVETATIPLPAGTGVGGSVDCPVGTSVVSGGAAPFTVGPDVILDSSTPIDGADADLVRDDGWAVNYNNPTGSSSNFRVYAVCATVDSVS